MPPIYAGARITATSKPNSGGIRVLDGFLTSFSGIDGFFIPTSYRTVGNGQMQVRAYSKDRSKRLCYLRIEKFELALFEFDHHRHTELRCQPEALLVGLLVQQHQQFWRFLEAYVTVK